MIPKNIYSYWDSEVYPPLVIHCISSWKRLNPSFEVFIYSDDMIKKTFNPPEEYFKLCPAHKSDWSRLQLLKTYGGVWLDATIFLHKPLSSWIDFKSNNLHIFKPPLLFSKYEMFDNWAFACTRNDTFIISWFELLNNSLEMGHSNFIKKIKETDQCPQFDNDLPYFMMHFCSAIIIQNNNFFKKNMTIIEADRLVFPEHKIDYLKLLYKPPPTYRLFTKITAIHRKYGKIIQFIGCFTKGCELSISMNWKYNYFVIIVIIVITLVLLNKKLPYVKA